MKTHRFYSCVITAGSEMSFVNSICDLRHYKTLRSLIELQASIRGVSPDDVTILSFQDMTEKEAKVFFERDFKFKK